MLTKDEQEALLELKQNGYSFSDAMGFIASSRMGNDSKVAQSLRAPEVEEKEPADAISDISRGFENAKTAVDEGLTRSGEASKRKSFIGRTSGQLGAGFRAAGEATGSLISGAIRALPFGTKAMDTVEEKVGAGVSKISETSGAKKTKELYGNLPQGVKTAFGDIGNVAMGAAGIAEALVAPGATKAFTTGIKEFAKTGLKEFGEAGIKNASKTGLAPENLMQRVARVSKGRQAAFEERAGESIGSFLVSRKIFGDPEEITTQLYKRMQESKSRVDKGLASVYGTYKDGSVLDAIEQLAEREAKVSSPRTPSPDQNRVNELLKKHNSEGLTLTEINEVKRLYERNIRVDYLKDNVSDKIRQANIVDSKLKQFIEDKAAQGGFANVKALNKETSLNKQLLDDLGAEYAGQQGNNLVSLSDAFFLAEAASSPAALVAFGIKRGLSSQSTMSAVARLMSKNKATRNLPSGELTEKLQLPAPASGASDVSNNVPINLPDVSQTRRDILESKNPNIQTTAKGYQSKGKVEIQGLDEGGNIVINDNGNVLIIPADKLPIIR